MTGVDYQKEYDRWVSSSKIDEETLIELSGLFRNEAEKESRFKGYMTFGTSGLRGLMRAGLNGMNVYTVRYATQGLANYIKHFEGGSERGVVIAFDSRNNSQLFAIETACVLAANGIKVFIFDDLRPTPELSFSVRELGAIAGVNVTASHNPKEYNGYKVYWEDGAQLSLEAADAVSNEIAKIDIFDDVIRLDFVEGRRKGIINIVGQELDEKYMQKVIAESHMTDDMRPYAKKLKIVYTPFHGAGAKLVPEVLDRVGFKNIVPVEEQMTADGNFPTVKSPNPENTEGFAMALEYARRENADIVIGTDPDSDRCGAVVSCNGDYKVLTGNQMGVLMLDYIIKSRIAEGRLATNSAVIKSIVSTKMANRVCEANGVNITEVLTGFRFIGEKMKEWEQSGEHEFIFGFEESIGFLSGTYARDKDAVVASMLMAEVAANFKLHGKCVYEGLMELYEEYGYYSETVKSYEFKGFDAQDRMKLCMQDLRDNTPAELGLAVEGCIDYLVDETGLSKSNVLSFNLEGGSVAIIRPSGTEPKIKTYVMTKADSIEEGNSIKEKIIDSVDAILQP